MRSEIESSLLGQQGLAAEGVQLIEIGRDRARRSHEIEDEISRVLGSVKVVAAPASPRAYSKSHPKPSPQAMAPSMGDHLDPHPHPHSQVVAAPCLLGSWASSRAIDAITHAVPLVTTPSGGRSLLARRRLHAPHGCR